MKRFRLKVAPWLAGLAACLGLAYVGHIQDVSASEDSYEAEKEWPTTTEYFLLRDLTVDTVNDRILTVAIKKNNVLSLQTGYMTIGGTNKPRCGSKCTDGTCDDFGTGDDTIFPATGTTYYGGLTMILDTKNIFHTRIPKGLFVKGTSAPVPGKLLATMSLMTDAYNDGTCYILTDGQTWTFRKYKANMD